MRTPDHPADQPFPSPTARSISRPVGPGISVTVEVIDRGANGVHTPGTARGAGVDPNGARHDRHLNRPRCAPRGPVRTSGLDAGAVGGVLGRSGLRHVRTIITLDEADVVAPRAQGLHHPVDAVAGQAEDHLDAGLDGDIHQCVSGRLGHVFPHGARRLPAMPAMPAARRSVDPAVRRIGFHHQPVGCGSTSASRRFTLVR